MNDVPLIKTNSINDINTSLIAIKKQLKQLNEALGLVDVSGIDTSVFVKKSDIVDVVESGNMNPVTSNAVVPVDEVTSGNMHSVTSNAVENVISGRATTINIENTTGNDATIRNRPSEKIASINCFNASKTGLAIDFDYNSAQIRIYYVLNGVTQGMKYVNLN